MKQIWWNCTKSCSDPPWWRLTHLNRFHSSKRLLVKTCDLFTSHLWRQRVRRCLSMAGCVQVRPVNLRVCWCLAVMAADRWMTGGSISSVWCSGTLDMMSLQRTRCHFQHLSNEKLQSKNISFFVHFFQSRFWIGFMSKTW